MRNNSMFIVHLLLFLWKNFTGFVGILLPSLRTPSTQNSVNTNKVEINNQNFNVKQVIAVVELMIKFIKKMTEHIEDRSVSKEIPPFARTFFIKQDSRQITLAATTEQKTDVKQPAATT